MNNQTKAKATKSNPNQDQNPCPYLNRAVIFTDGACQNNGQGNKAKAGIGVYWELVDKPNQRVKARPPLSTNQPSQELSPSLDLVDAYANGYQTNEFKQPNLLSSNNNISRPLSSGRQTNQRAEIEAARIGIEQARSLGYSSVLVKTDSQYVKNAAEIWIPKWEQTGYLTRRKPVVNETEFRALKAAMDTIEVHFEKIPCNLNRADHLAKAATRIT